MRYVSQRVRLAGAVATEEEELRNRALLDEVGVDAACDPVLEVPSTEVDLGVGPRINGEALLPQVVVGLKRAHSCWPFVRNRGALRVRRRATSAFSVSVATA